VIAALDKGKTPSEAGGLSTVEYLKSRMSPKRPTQDGRADSTGEAPKTPFPVLDRQSSSADLPEAPTDLAYVIVNEAGASVYSASAVGRENSPPTMHSPRHDFHRPALARPLSELVKIDPQSIRRGLYQHDVNPRHLKEMLEAVIESSFNEVGVDLNSASVPCFGMSPA